MHGERATPLFAINPKSQIEVFSADAPPAVGAGWTVIALIDPSQETEEEVVTKRSVAQAA